MKLYTKILMLILFLTSLLSFSQTVVKRDTISGTELILEMDSSVEKALTATESNCDKKTYAKNNQTYSKSNNTNYTPVKRTITKAELCRRNPKFLGAKILVGVTKTYKDANVLKAKFRRAFPRMRPMTDASLRPNFKVLAGSYVTKNSGKSDLRKVKRLFPSAVLVNYQVYCTEAE